MSKQKSIGDFLCDCIGNHKIKSFEGVAKAIIAEYERRKRAKVKKVRK